MKTSNYLIIIIHMIACCSSLAQEQLHPDGYRQWHSLSYGPVSSKGDWVTYWKRYPDTDTLFLKHIPSGRVLSYPQASNPIFTSDGGFFAVAGKDTVSVLNIMTGRVRRLTVTGYLLAANKHTIITYDPQSRTLEAIGFKNDERATIANVADASRNPSKDQVLLIRRDTLTLQSKVVLLDFRDKLVQKGLVERASGTYSLPSWERSGNYLALFSITSEGFPESIIHYDFKNVKPIKNELVMDQLPGGFQGVLSGLFITQDGKRILFDLTEKESEDEKTSGGALVWTTKTKAPMANTHSLNRSFTKWIWSVDTGAASAIETPYFPKAILSGDHKYAMVFNDGHYLPAFKYDGEYNDYYLLELSSGKKELLLEKHPYDLDYMQMSPEGKYVCYFKNGHWWTYNIAKKKHTCISAAIPDNFYTTNYDIPGTPRIFPLGGWSLADKAVYVHGQYDVWKVATDGSASQRITNVEGTKVKYRIYDDGTVTSNGGNVGGFNGKVIEENNIVLYSVNTQTLAEGYSVYSKNKGVFTLKSGDKHYYSIRKITGQQKWIFLESDFDQPATLYLAGTDSTPIAIAKANEQQGRYQWGSSKLIHYTANNKFLKGALFYPAGYTPDKKYPMIVYIYERLSNSLHKYVMPSSYTDNGVNITNFTLNGYFVLCPDISYKLNEPGNSALECVTAAVSKAIEEKSIDKNRIGLIGHSFGGYETSFIIGKSNLFRAAVAGAAITDLRSHYLFVNSRGRVNLDTFERFQFRTTVAFNNPLFEANSPISFAHNIGTPLLLWTSDQDPVVSPLQSIELQTALWRLGKPGTLLMYPKEDHSLMEENNQKDLTEKVVQWFSHYLKDGEAPAWTQ